MEVWWTTLQVDMIRAGACLQHAPACRAEAGLGARACAAALARTTKLVPVHDTLSQPSRPGRLICQ